MALCVVFQQIARSEVPIWMGLGSHPTSREPAVPKQQLAEGLWGSQGGDSLVFPGQGRTVVTNFIRFIPFVTSRFFCLTRKEN